MRSASSCPACSSSDVLQIVYGEPDADTLKAAERGELVIGGYVLTEDLPLARCRACGSDFGRLADDPAWSERAPLYLGEPPFDDVEAAARLLVRYRNGRGLSPEGSAMFLMMSGNAQAVMARADEIEKAEKKSP